MRVHVKAFKNAKTGAGYACKYIGKSFDGDHRQTHRKRYLVSKRAKVPIKKGEAWNIEEIKEYFSQFDDVFLFESIKSEDWHGPKILWLTF